jgi:hypothetical protein
MGLTGGVFNLAANLAGVLTPLVIVLLGPLLHCCDGAARSLFLRVPVGESRTDRVGLSG